MAGLAEILEENSCLRAERAAREALLQQQRAAIGELRAQLDVLRADLAKRDAMLDEVRRRAEFLEQLIALRDLERASPASQRFVPDTQGVLQFPTDASAPPRACRDALERSEEDDDDAPPPPGGDGRRRKRAPRGKKKPRRRSREDFANLPSRSTLYTLPPGLCCERCGRPLHVAGTAQSFRIRWQPGHFFVEDYACEKRSCGNLDCSNHAVLTASVPHALERSLCGDDLLARVIVDKYADHIPLHRQARRMAREGFEVGTNTLSGWVCAAGSLLRQLALGVRDGVLQAAVLQADDTGHPVQDKGDGTLRKGRMWAFSDGEQAFYAFTPTKEGAFPAALLDGFAGDRLLVDGGSEFNEAVRKHGLIRAGCWSHLRTYFYKARHHHPEEAGQALGTIRDLFMIERTLAGLPPPKVRERRQELSKPLVDGLFEWIKALSRSVRPKSRLGKALAYALGQQSELMVYLDHGDMPMHNNLSELLLRQQVVGRKNWLFSRSEGGAEVAGHLYTLIGSCMLQGIDPHEYLVDVLRRLPGCRLSQVRELTPKAWRLARERDTLEAA